MFRSPAPFFAAPIPEVVVAVQGGAKSPSYDDEEGPTVEEQIAADKQRQEEIAHVLTGALNERDDNIARAKLTETQAVQRIDDAMSRWNTLQKEALERWTNEDDFGRVDLMTAALLKNGQFKDAYLYIKKSTLVMGGIMMALHKKGREIGALSVDDTDPVVALTTELTNAWRQASKGRREQEREAAARAAAAAAEDAGFTGVAPPPPDQSEEIAALKNQITSYRIKVEQLEKDLDKSRLETHAYKTVQKEDHKFVVDKEKAIASTINRLAQKETELVTIKNKVGSLENALTEARRTIMSVTEALRVSEDRATAAKRAAGALRTQVLKATEKSKTKNSEEELLRAVCDDGEVRISELEKLLHARNGAMANATKRHAEEKKKLTERIKELEQVVRKGGEDPLGKDLKVEKKKNEEEEEDETRGPKMKSKDKSQSRERYGIKEVAGVYAPERTTNLVSKKE